MYRRNASSKDKLRTVLDNLSIRAEEATEQVLSDVDNLVPCKLQRKLEAAGSQRTRPNNATNTTHQSTHRAVLATKATKKKKKKTS
jgi:hypothetical protein